MSARYAAAENNENFSRNRRGEGHAGFHPSDSFRLYNHSDFSMQKNLIAGPMTTNDKWTV